MKDLLNLYHWCLYWVNLRDAYNESLDDSLVPEMTMIELKIEKIVNEIRLALIRKGQQVDPLQSYQQS